MATISKTSEGFNMVHLSKTEQEYVWQQISKPIANQVFHLRDKRYTYQIVSEKETGFQKYEVVLKANGAIKKINTTLCNQQNKISQTVAKMWQL